MNEYKEPKDIQIGEDQSLADVIASHNKWVNDVVGGLRANLESANLESANLESANLVRANLVRAKGLFLLGPIGSRGDFLYAVRHDKKIMVKAGCFWGTLAEFKTKVKSTHNGNVHDETYNAAIVLIRKYFKLVFNIDEEAKENDHE